MNNEDNKVMIAKKEGITSTILSVMKDHLPNANVQEYGCATRPFELVG